MLKHLICAFKRGFWLIPLIWVAIIYNVNIHFGERYTSDSYGFYLLAKNIIAGNGYYSPAIRDLYLDPAGPLLSRSFPPLFPLLVGITDYFLNEGVAAGQIINLFLGMLGLYVWFLIARRISYHLFFIPFVLAIIHTFTGTQSLWVDAIAGRSNTVTWLLLLITLYCLTNPFTTSNYKTPIWVGVLLGLLTLARFDTMIFCFALPAAIFCFTKTTLKQTAIMYGTLLLVMLPWAIRNMIVFNTPFASDNTITVLSTYPRIAQLSFFDGGIALGKDNTALWIHERTNFLKDNVGVLLRTLAPFNAKLIVSLYTLGIVCAFWRRKINSAMWIYFIFTLTWIVLHFISISLTPYGIDPRYWCISDFMIIGGAGYFVTIILQKLISLKWSTINDTKINITSKKMMLIEIFLLMLCVALTVHKYSKALYLNKNDYWWQWTQHIDSAPVKPGEYVATTDAEIISFYTGWNTIYLPENTRIFNNDYKAWLKNWKPSYLIVDLYDFNNPLAAYPHASVSTLLDTVVLLKINLDETTLTKKDTLENEKSRNLWRQKIYSQIPTTDNFYIVSDDYYTKGVAKQWAGFFVPNTPENQIKFAVNKVVVLPNGERRLITESISDRTCLRIRVLGDPFAGQFHELPITYTTEEGDSPFFITSGTWFRGVAREWAGFYVENNADNKKRYQIGYKVTLPTGESRQITKFVEDGIYLNVYLTGTPIDGAKVGPPDHFKVTPTSASKPK